jgi:hypothetical protein
VQPIKPTEESDSAEGSYVKLHIIFAAVFGLQSSISPKTHLSLSLSLSLSFSRRSNLAAKFIVDYHQISLSIAFDLRHLFDHLSLSLSHSSTSVDLFFNSSLITLPFSP